MSDTTPQTADGKVLFHFAMSLDGFVAGPEHRMDWMTGVSLRPGLIGEYVETTGAILGGRNGWDQAIDGSRPYGGAWQGPQFVFTRDDPGTAAPGFTFVGPDIKQAVQRAKDAAGGKYVSILGPGLAAQVLGAGLLDEILVHVAPVLLGDGKRLYDHPGTASIGLEPIGLTPQMTNIWMRVQPGVLPGE